MTFKPTGIRIDSLVGRATGPAEDKFNGQVTELTVAVGHGYKDQKNNGEWKETGTTFVTYSASGDWANALRQVGKGDLVEITDAALETRKYTKTDGGDGFAVSARFGSLEILERKGERQGGSSDGFTPSGDGGGGF